MNYRVPQIPNITPQVEARMLLKFFKSNIVVSLCFAVLAAKVIVPKVIEGNDT